jgi:hypothetical protein
MPPAVRISVASRPLQRTVKYLVIRYSFMAFPPQQQFRRCQCRQWRLACNAYASNPADLGAWLR